MTGGGQGAHEAAARLRQRGRQPPSPILSAGSGSLLSSLAPNTVFGDVELLGGSTAGSATYRDSLVAAGPCTVLLLKKEKMLKVEVLPKHLDEEVARYMVQGFGGVITKLTKEQADYIGVDVNGPYKPEHYKY